VCRLTLTALDRLLILPETIGSVSYLSHNEHLIPSMVGGLFIEMLSLDYPHALQLSFEVNTAIDEIFLRTVQQHDHAHWTGAFRMVVGNDERQFNGPGVRVPMRSLSRVLPHGEAQRPYPQYHSTDDNPDNERCGGVQRHARSTLQDFGS
jgi:aminopeptidase-like protein